MPELFLENAKTGKKYKILGRDQSAGTIKLVGEAGVEFDEKYDVELLKRLGYELKQGA